MALRLFTNLGGPAVRSVVVVGSCLVLVLRRRWGHVFFLAGTVGGTGIGNSVIKKLVGRRRPGRLSISSRGRDSFPSGHSSGTVALCGAALYLLQQGTRESSRLYAARAAAAAFIGLVG